MFGRTVVLAVLILNCADCQFIGKLKFDEDGYLPEPVDCRNIPVSWDWNARNMVTPVKNQGQCNVCWAFSIVANIESHLRIYAQQNLVLSEQFLVDCTHNRGCTDEVNVLKIFAYIVSVLGGVLKESDYYSYEGQKNKCRWQSNAIKNVTEDEDNKGIMQRLYNATGYSKFTRSSNPSLIPVIGFRRVQSDEEIMACFVYKYGPITAGINSKSMTKYSNNNYIDEPTDEDCDPKNLDHNVLIVGYSTYIDKDTKKETPYWIIKNSWGTQWGDGGYYYLVRGRNACGIASDVSFAYVI